MNGKLPVIGLVVASLVIGFGLGRAALSIARGRSWLVRSVGLVGAVICFVGLIADSADRRFLLLAGGGLGLQLAWLVNSRAEKIALRDDSSHEAES